MELATSDDGVPYEATGSPNYGDVCLACPKDEPTPFAAPIDTLDEDGGVAFLLMESLGLTLEKLRLLPREVTLPPRDHDHAKGNKDSDRHPTHRLNSNPDNPIKRNVRLTLTKGIPGSCLDRGKDMLGMRSTLIACWLTSAASIQFSLRAASSRSRIPAVRCVSAADRVAVAISAWDGAGTPGEEGGYLVFDAGERIEVVEEGEPGGWWRGELNGRVGWFPAAFCTIEAAPTTAVAADSGSLLSGIVPSNPYVTSKAERLRAKFGDDEAEAQGMVLKSGVRRTELEDRLGKDVARFKAEQGPQSDEEPENRLINRVIGVLGTILTYNFFIIIGFFAWFMTGVFAQYGAHNYAIIGAFQANWVRGWARQGVWLWVRRRGEGWAWKNVASHQQEPRPSPSQPAGGSSSLHVLASS